MSSDAPDFKPKTWFAKFACAFRGVWVGVASYGLASFTVHLPVMAAVLVLGIVREVTWTEWYLLLVCITVVLAAEMFNSSIEALSQAITEDYDPFIRDALDVASGAVFVTVIGAAAVGILILL